MVDGELRVTAGVSGSGVQTVQELQFEPGEGPCVDAWASMEPVLEPDLAAPEVVHWPAFAVGGVAAEVLAVFAFPLVQRIFELHTRSAAVHRQRQHNSHAPLPEITSTNCAQPQWSLP
jgi:hypothetical protein